MLKIACMLLTLLSGSLLLTPSASAQGLKERREIKSTKAIMAKRLGFFKKDCGYKVAHEIQWKTFLGKTKGRWALTTAAHYCASALFSMGYLCGDAEGKKAMQSSIRKVICTWDANATKAKLKRRGPTLKLDKKNKVLRVGYCTETNNIHPTVKTWLEKKL